jgi:hypothetical protein
MSKGKLAAGESRQVGGGVGVFVNAIMTYLNVRRIQKIMALYNYCDISMAELLSDRRTEPQLSDTVNFTCDYIIIQCAANRKIHNSKCKVR